MMDIEKLIEHHSIEITEGTLEINLNTEQPSEIPVREILDRINALGLDPCYASNGLALAFYDGKKYYVTNSTAEEILKAHGFSRTGDLYVPFCGFSRPADKNLLERWLDIKSASLN